MCPSLTWGTCSVHYLLDLPLMYAPRSATPNGFLLFVKLACPLMLLPSELCIRCIMFGHC